MCLVGRARDFDRAEERAERSPARAPIATTESVGGLDLDRPLPGSPQLQMGLEQAALELSPSRSTNVSSSECVCAIASAVRRCCSIAAACSCAAANGSHDPASNIGKIGLV